MSKNREREHDHEHDSADIRPLWRRLLHLAPVALFVLLLIYIILGNVLPPG